MSRSLPNQYVKSLGSIEKIGRDLRAGNFGVEDFTRRVLTRIEAVNPVINAYYSVFDEAAITAARRLDAELAQGLDRGPLHGIPVAIKDNIDVSGVATTCGSPLLKDSTADQDAKVVAQLKKAGAVILGKTAMNEFAYGMSGINAHFGNTRNPWNVDYDPGGSSSGSAAAVAAGLAVFSIGTDTGGSVRQPAHCCGVVGFKPTFDRLSTEGVFPLAHSMDHLGMFAQCVQDTKTVFKLLKSSKDTSGQQPAKNRLNRVRIGALRGLLLKGQQEVVVIFEKALSLLAVRSAIVSHIELQATHEALKQARVIFKEAESPLQDFLENTRTYLSNETREKLVASQQITPAEYENAQEFRNQFRDQVQALFKKCDVLALPTSTATSARFNLRPPEQAHLAWRNCGLFSFTGHPAISIPIGFTSNGLPVGIMLVGSFGDDEKLLEVAERCERALTPNWLPGSDTQQSVRTTHLSV